MNKLLIIVTTCCISIILCAWYRQSDKRCYLNEVANDILEETPSDTGKVGYICEYDS